MRQLFKQHKLYRIVLLALCAFTLIAGVIALVYKWLSPIEVTHPNTTELQAYYNKGKQLMRDGNYDDALKIMISVAQRAGDGKSLEDTMLSVKAYNNAGVISYFNNDYTGAYSFYRKALQTGGNANAYFVQTNLATIYKLFHDTQKTTQLLKQSYNNARKAKDYEHLNTAYYNILNLAVLDNISDSILPLIRDYNDLKIPSNGNSRYIYKVGQGVEYLLTNQSNKAISSFKLAEQFADSSKQPIRGKIDCNMYIAESFKRINRPDSALIYYKNALEYAEDDGLKDYLVDIYAHITDCYSLLGNAESAINSKNRFYTLRDSLSSMEALSAIKNIETNFEIQQYENKVSQMIIEKRRITLNYIVALCFLVITVLLLVITFRQKHKLKRSNITLFNKNIQLLEAYEENKNRVLANQPEIIEKPEEVNMLSIYDGVEQNVQLPEMSTDDINNIEEKNVNISYSEQVRIKDAIVDFFFKSDEYLSNDFSLKRLCEIVNSNRLYVSYVINNLMDTNFHSLLNEYRINEAKIRLLDNAKFGNLTIESIAESVGYKSRSNFTRNFKATTGLTPSEFIAIAKSTSQP